MSWWKYKPLYEVKWREPYRYTLTVSKLTETNTRWLSRPFFALILSGIFMLSWWTAKTDTSKNGPSTVVALPLAVVSGLAIAYFTSFAEYFSPREIGLGEKAIVAMKGGTSQGWRYEHITSVRFERVNFKGKSLLLMIATMADSSQFVAAVSNKTRVSEICEVLQDKGVEAIETA